MDPHLTNEDVADILALLDSLPYDEFDLETARFRLTLRRTPGGWTQSTQILSAPEPLAVGGNASASDEQAVTDEAVSGRTAGPSAGRATGTMSHRAGYNRDDVTSSRLDRGAHGASETNVTSETGGDAAGDRESATDGGRAGGDAAGDRESATDGGRAGGNEDAGLVVVRAPLPGTFYRAPRPGAAPFVEVGSRVGADTVIGIVETMKLMNSVPAGVAGVVAEFCVANAEHVAQEAALLRIRADE